MDGRASTIDRSVRVKKHRLLDAVGPVLILLAAVAWTVVASPEPALRLTSDTLARLMFWPAVWLVSARIGGGLCGSDSRGMRHLVWDGLCGMPVLIAAWLVVGLLPGGFQASVILAVLIAAGFAGARWGRGSALGGGSTNGVGWLLAAVAAAGLVWNRVPAFFFDTLAYHYAQPELWLLEGQIAPESWNLHSWFPPGASILYGVGLSLGGEPWAADANLLGGLVALALVAELARRGWGASAAPVAVVLALGLPLIPFAIAIPGADLWHGTFALAAIATLLLRGATPDGPWIRRAALISAGALLTKYLAIVVPLGVGVLWVLAVGGEPKLRRRARQIAALVAPSLLLFAPWMIANATRLGNPLAPMLASVFTTAGLADGGAASFAADARGGLPGLSDLAALWPRLIAGESAGLYPSPAWGWSALALVPVLVWGAVHDRRVRITLSIAAMWWVLWFATFRWERFLVGVTLLGAVSAAGALATLWRRGPRGRVVAMLVVLVVCSGAATAVTEVIRFNGGASVVAGAETPRALTERVFPTTRLFRVAGERLDPRSDRLLFVGEMRHYRLALARAAPTGFNRHPLAEAIDAGLSATEIDRALRDLGFTHLLLDAGWVSRSATRYPSLRSLHDHPDAFRAYVRGLGPPLAVEGQAALFAIPESSR